MAASRSDDTDYERMDDQGHPVRDRNCGLHGTFVSTLYGARHWTSCPTCEAEIAERRRQQDEHAIEADRAYRRRQAFAETGLVGRFAEASFATFVATSATQKQTLAACRAYAESLTRLWCPLFLIGPPGVGKTHLAAGIVRHVVLDTGGWTARMLSAREMVRKIRSSWRRDAEQTEEAVINEHACAGLLVVDELGLSGSESELALLFDVLDQRYQRRLPVVLLSNLPMPDLRSTLGDRLFDRMREGSQVLACQWPSHRKETS